MTELKHCPFCGKKESVITDSYCENNYNCHWVICDSSLGGCGACSGARKTIEEAIEIWNTRDNDKHQILDADGIPFEAGDIVWTVSNGDKCVVTKTHNAKIDIIYDDGGIGEFMNPNLFVHKEPDTLKKITKDASKATFDYWNCREVNCSSCNATIDNKTPEDFYGVSSCETAKILDLLDRQRKILERTKQ